MRFLFLLLLSFLYSHTLSATEAIQGQVAYDYAVACDVQNIEVVDVNEEIMAGGVIIKVTFVFSDGGKYVVYSNEEETEVIAYFSHKCGKKKAQKK